MSILDKLLKSKKDLEPKVDEKEVEKSFDDALDTVKGEVSKAGHMSKEGMPMKKKKKKMMDSDDSDDKEEGYDYESGKMKKSRDNDPAPVESDDDIDSSIEKAIDEATNAHQESESDELFVEAEPIIKALMKHVDKKINRVMETVKEQGEIQKAMAELSVAQGTIIKSLKGITDAPLPRRGISVQNKTFVKSNTEGDDTEMTKSEALTKLDEIIKAKVLDENQVSVIESRIQRGSELPDYFYSAIKKVSKDS